MFRGALWALLVSSFAAVQSNALTFSSGAGGNTGTGGATTGNGGSGCIICSKSNKNKPSSLTFRYTAGQGVSSHRQDSRAYGALTGTFPQTATITFPSGFSTTVSDGDQFTVPGSFSADSKVTISGQIIGFHTSCSVDLAVDNRFGPLTVLGGGQCPIVTPDPCGDFGCCPIDASAPGQESMLCVDAACSNCYQDPCGVYGCCPNTNNPKQNYFGSNCPQPECVTKFSDCPSCPAPSPSPPSPPPTQLGCTICDQSNKNRPSSLTFLYTAGQGVSNHQQDSRAYGALTGTYPATATISMQGVSGTVSDGETFTITGSFGAESEITVAGQLVGFHTSCSVPLVTGNQFGAITVVGGGSCGIAMPVMPSCFPYGCCAGSSVACTDASCNNCCDASLFPPTCELCCPDGSPKPCCSYEPVFVKEAEIETHVYTDKCGTTGMPDTATATSLANFIEDFGGSSCKSVNDPDTIVAWAVKMAADVEYQEYEHQDQLNVLRDAHELICDDLENFECPAIPINFRCCDPCDDADPTAQCTTTIGIWQMRDCPTCTKMPRVVDRAKSLPLEHFQCGAVSGSLPASTYADLKAWYDNYGGKTCKSRNDESGEMIMAASMTFEELETALCLQAQGSCPSVPISFECCDPCQPDALCVEQMTSVFVPDCCPHAPDMLRPPSSKIVNKVSSCDTTQTNPSLPVATAQELNDWLTNNGGGICKSQNDKLISEDDMIWTVTPGQNSAEFAMCAADSGCPSVEIEFRCCDPCDPVNKCITATAVFQIYDKNPPVIFGITDGEEAECAGDPDTQLAAWVNGAVCTDGEGSATLTNSFEGVPTFATSSYCNMYSTVTLKCEDECGLISTAVYFHEVADTLPPTLVAAPQDVSYECDGLGNAAQLDAWIRSAGGMKVVDACQGACPLANEPVIGHYREETVDKDSVDRAMMTGFANCCMATTATCLSCQAGLTMTEYCNYNPHVQGCVGFGGNIINIIDQYSPATAMLINRQAMITSTLSASGPFTLFAPTNAAWNAVPYPSDFQGSQTVSMLTNLKNDVYQAENVLMDHIFIGRLNLADLSKGQNIKTVSNLILTVESTSPYTFSSANSNYWLTFEIIDGADVSNGMIYTIDKVIVGSWGTWAGYNWEGAINFDNEQHPAKDIDGCSKVHFDNSEVRFEPCAVQPAGSCDQCAEVTFSADDICNTGTVDQTAIFKITDTTGPEIVKKAKDAEFAYTGNTGGGGLISIDQERYTKWLERHAGAVAEDLCTEVQDLVWTHDGDLDLPNKCNGRGAVETCACVIPVEFCVEDCTGLKECTTATFTLVDTDSSPKINEDDTCPGMDLEFPCDSRCGAFDLWEFNARTAMTQWVDGQGCLCAKDCTEVTWSALDVPLENLCGTCGTVTFVATDTTFNTAQKELKYCFPEIEVDIDVCSAAEFGCCPGTEILRSSDDGTNCPCTSTLYGCCPDGMTARTDALGNNCFTPVPPSPPTPLGCTICDQSNKNRPTSLTFLYTAGQGVSNHQQDSRAYGALTGTFPATATLVMQGFTASVVDGETFTITGSFGAESEITVAGQLIGFHTSCSVPLVTGNQFGPLKVLGGGSCPVAADPVQCGKWGCCEGTDDPKLNGAGTNCCGQFGCCDDGSDCTDSNCGNCKCSTQRYGCCPESSLAREGRYGLQCPVQCGMFGCCTDSDVRKQDGQGSNCNPDPVCTFPQVCENDIIDPGTTPDPCSLLVSDFGCCPGEMAAIFKEDAIGSNCDCSTSQFGCCPFPHTEQAAGNLAKSDCPCGVHGCCTGTEIVKTDSGGTNCPCETTEFGCCPGTEDAQDDAGGSNCPCGTTAGAPECPCEEIIQPQCTICDQNNKQRPSSLTILYTSEGANVNGQGNRAYGELTGTFGLIATISTGGFSQTINDGDVFTITATNKFDANTEWSVSGKVLGFHTSCSVPLATNDRYGPFTILGGGSCLAPSPCPAPNAAENVAPKVVNIVAPSPAPPTAKPATIRVQCKDPCTQSTYFKDCQLESSSECYNFNPLVCTILKECLVAQCEAFATKAVGDSATSTLCQYDEACPGGTSPVQFLNFRDPATGIVRPEVSPDKCSCCELPKKNIVCVACGTVVLVECFQNDPSCTNYNLDACAVADVDCDGDPAKAGQADLNVATTNSNNNNNGNGNGNGNGNNNGNSAGSVCSVEFDACSVAKTKFKSIILEWTGNVNGNNHVQTNKKLQLKPKSIAGASKSVVKSIGKQRFKGVPKNPSVGERFTLSASDLGRAFLPTAVSLKAGKGKFRFMTNCKKDSLRMGDEFGPFKVVGFETNKAKSTCMTFDELLRTMNNNDDDVSEGANGNPLTPISQSALSEDASTEAPLSAGAIAAAIVVGVGGLLVVFAGVGLFRSRSSWSNDGATLVSDTFVPGGSGGDGSIGGGQTFSGGGFSEDEYVPRHGQAQIDEYTSVAANQISGRTSDEDGTIVHSDAGTDEQEQVQEIRTAI